MLIPNLFAFLAEENVVFFLPGKGCHVIVMISESFGVGTESTSVNASHLGHATRCPPACLQPPMHWGTATIDITFPSTLLLSEMHSCLVGPFSYLWGVCLCCCHCNLVLVLVLTVSSPATTTLLFLPSRFLSVFLFIPLLKLQVSLGQVGG